MMKRLWLVVAIVVLASAACMAGADRRQQLIERLKRVATVETNVMVAMRDGVRLATDVVRPQGSGKAPAILMRTPYRKHVGGAVGTVPQGYAYVAQDVRGRYESEGEHRPFLDDLNDAFDTIAWLAKQPWCDGNVGMTGGSYVGFTQLAAALTQPPALKCIAPTVPPSDFGHGTVFFGGAIRLELAQGWLLGQSLNSQRMLRGRVPREELERWKPKANFRQWCWHVPLRGPGPIALGGPGYAACWSDMITVEVSGMVSSREDYDPYAAAEFCFHTLDTARREAGVSA